MSENDTTAEHKDIMAALLAAQPHFTVPERTGVNKHFNNTYSTLGDIVRAVKAPLNEAGIVYFFTPSVSELGEYVTATLYHPASGTKLEAPVQLITKSRDMQQLKSAGTYARRIGLEDLTGVATRDDDDAEDDRKGAGGNPIGTGLGDAWTQGVLDSLPENATPTQKAEAFAKAMCDGFKGKKEKALQNELSRRKGIIASLEERFPELHAKVIDAYETAMMEATDNFTSGHHR